MNMKSNSYDKEFVFSDFLGIRTRIFGTSLSQAVSTVRDLLVHADRYTVDKALDIIKYCEIKDGNGTVYKEVGVRYY